MANIEKPDLSLIWASTGDVLKPSDSKIQGGWQPEIPPRQWFNWYQNKVDVALAHINQHGVPVWDSKTEYQANVSYTQGSNGKVYKALTTNVNVNPVTDSGTNWVEAFLSYADRTLVATASQSRAQTDNSVYLSPVQLVNAFTSLSKQLLEVNGYQALPGGLLLQWGRVVTSSTTPSATLKVPFANQVLLAMPIDTGASNDVAYGAWRRDTTTNTTLQFSFNVNPVEFSYFALGY